MWRGALVIELHMLAVSAPSATDLTSFRELRANACQHDRVRKWLKRLFGIGIVASFAYWVWWLLKDEQRSNPIEWRPQPFPSPPMPVLRSEPAADTPDTPDAAKTVVDVAWVTPDGDCCPATHPVKAKLASGIYHVPGGQLYERTIPDRCYRDADTADADGLRASKR